MVPLDSRVAPVRHVALELFATLPTISAVPVAISVTLVAPARAARLVHVEPTTSASRHSPQYFRRADGHRLALAGRSGCASDLLPLVARLVPGERDLMVRPIEARSENDASVCEMTSPGREEFSSD